MVEADNGKRRVRTMTEDKQDPKDDPMNEQYWEDREKSDDDDYMSRLESDSLNQQAER